MTAGPDGPDRGGPRIVPVEGEGDRDAVGREAAEHVRAGGLLAYPTETVYGFGGAPTEKGVRHLRTLKGRASGKPFLVLIPALDDAPDLEWTPGARRLAGAFWPGPVTLIVGDPRRRYPRGVRSAAGAVAVRASPHPLVRALVADLRRGLTSTSANAPGEGPARSGAEAAAAARALGAGPEVWVLDAGPSGTSPPSTLVDCTVDPPAVRRRGPVAVEALREVIPEIRPDGDRRNRENGESHRL